MKVLSFIRQRSFARYVMFDLAEAARRIEWAAHWLDLEGLLLQHADAPEAEKRRVVADALAGIERIDPDIVFSYGLEYLEPVFQSFLPDVTTGFHEVVGRRAAFFFFDFGFPFDRPVDAQTAPYIGPLQGWHGMVFCWDRDALDVVRQYGVRKAFHFPMAVNERMFYPRDPSREERAASGDIPVLFVGGPTPDRMQALEPLAPLGLQIYGYDRAAWEASPALAACYAGEVLERDRAAELYSRARISVNITRAHGASSLNMRVYEAMACGSLMLTDDKSDARRLFTDGVELATWRDPADLVAKARHFLTQDEERLRIAQAGMQRVRAEHTYEVRLRAIEPTLKQFRHESAAALKLDEFLASDPARALRFIRQLEADRLVSYNRDNLKMAEARAQRALGESARAAAALAEAQRINPRLLLKTEGKT